MPRTPSTGADAQIIARMAARGVKVSVYQLERWRAAGLLPRNSRRSLGRGRGTTADLKPEVIRTAETLARSAQQGRKYVPTDLLQAVQAGDPAAVRAAVIEGLTSFATRAGAALSTDSGRGDDGVDDRLDAAARLSRAHRHYGGIHSVLWDTGRCRSRSTTGVSTH
ncbi:hypothetical protein [Streptomyces sp. NPDC051776]|uniref:hypothetical protein n=1 Tax=Streptomyces sp. NPDC051776 TaxID=3155414 RepID=UPI00342602DD